MKQKNLTPVELNRLKKAYLSGTTERETAMLMRISQGTVSNYFVKFKQEGITTHSAMQQHFICKGLFTLKTA